MLAIRAKSATSASASARQTSSAGRWSRPPADRCGCPATEAVSALRIMTPPHPLQTTRAPGDPGPLKLVGRFRLLQRGIDRGELGVQVGAEAVDHSDNRERNAGCDQAVFDGGGAGLILHETRNQVLHR